MASPRMKTLESALPSITALVALLALLASLWTAWETKRQATAANAQIELERKPILVLTGAPEFLLQDRANKTAPPRNVLFLEPTASRMIDLDPTIPTYTHDGYIIEHPPLFSRFVLTNGGRVPVVNVKIPVRVFTYAKPDDMSDYTQQDANISVSILGPGATFIFAIANGSTIPARYEFNRQVTITRVDTERLESVTLFTDDGVVNAEHFVNQGVARRQAEVPKK